jgi:hypothetical protein
MMQAKAIRIVDRDSSEWEAMWQELANMALNRSFADPTECPCPVSGESWQYLGTFTGPDGCPIHEFRHRLHPATGRREYVHIPATPEFEED